MEKLCAVLDRVDGWKSDSGLRRVRCLEDWVLGWTESGGLELGIVSGVGERGRVGKIEFDVICEIWDQLSCSLNGVRSMERLWARA